MSASFLLRPARTLLPFACLASAVLPIRANGGGGMTERASFVWDGSEVSSACQRADISSNGRYVAYASQEALLPADLNGTWDVYVYDREEGDLVCASTTPTGVFGNGASNEASISGDGRWVAFQTDATNLVGMDFNISTDVLLKDLETGAIERMSSAIGALNSAAGVSVAPAVSESGRFVAFQSAAPNLLPGDLNGTWDIFVRDTVANSMLRASVGFVGEANGPSYRPSISSNGERVSYHSNADNLVMADTNGDTDVFVTDLAAGVTKLLSRSLVGPPGNGTSYWSTISADGSRVLFASEADDMFPGDFNGTDDIFFADVLTGQVELASASTVGLSGNGQSLQPDLSRDGQYAVFLSLASDLTAKTSPFWDVYLRDLDNRETWLVSRANGIGDVADDSSSLPAVAGGGLYVAYESDATNLDPADTNGVADIFVRSVLADPVAYCTGTVTSDGCLPEIQAVGTPSASENSGFEIRATNVPSNKTSMLFYGINGREDKPFLGGTLCVKGPKLRTPKIDSGSLGGGSCDGFLSFDMNAFNAGALGGNPHAALALVGQQVNAQFWGRDPAAGPFHVYLSDAIEFYVGP